jgi:hypothetical protein
MSDGPSPKSWAGVDPRATLRHIFDAAVASADPGDKIIEEKDRGDIFEIFIEGYLATQTITQRVNHWVVGDIPLSLRERYKLPNDGTGIGSAMAPCDGLAAPVTQSCRRAETQHTFSTR